MEGVDYAADHPSPAGLAAAGKRFVVRYAGAGGSWKHLSRAEADSLRAAGLWLVANVEGAASGLTKGRDVGASWARQADAAFRALGMPADRPIYLSADWDVSAAQWPAVADALLGAASVLGPERVGVYGSYDCVRWAARDGVAAWFWQTYAWSGGKWFDGNHIEQYRNHVALAGGIVDLCRAKRADFGQWGQQEDDTMALTDKLTGGRYKGRTVEQALNDIGDQAYLAAVRTDFLANRLGLAARLDAILAAAVDDGSTTVTMSAEDRTALAAQLADAIHVPTPADVAGEFAGRLQS